MASEIILCEEILSETGDSESEVETSKFLFS